MTPTVAVNKKFVTFRRTIVSAYRWPRLDTVPSERYIVQRYAALRAHSAFVARLIIVGGYSRIVHIMRRSYIQLNAQTDGDSYSREV